jgi:hypothetical protein
MGMKPRPTAFEFAFFGAGAASYFEWAEVHVCFTRRPSKAERESIAKRVPPPLQESIQFSGHHVYVAAGQFAHVGIAETYPGAGDPSDESQWDGGRWFFAATEQVDAFNADIEAWLHETHKICPILTAYRMEDCESGGTDLSAWHKQSRARSAEVIQQLEKLHKSEKKALDHMLAGIVAMSK